MNQPTKSIEVNKELLEFVKLIFRVLQTNGSIRSSSVVMDIDDKATDIETRPLILVARDLIVKAQGGVK